MKGIERLTGSSDWDFYSWTVENYDDDLLDVCERENAADVLADLQGLLRPQGSTSRWMTAWKRHTATDAVRQRRTKPRSTRWT